jgi:hypothetical protein
VIVEPLIVTARIPAQVFMRLELGGAIEFAGVSLVRMDPAARDAALAAVQAEAEAAIRPYIVEDDTLVISPRTNVARARA